MSAASNAFLLDTNVFIEPKNRWYPFDVVPGYWEFLGEELGGERLRSIAPVYEELQGHEDDLAAWAKELGRERFEDCASDPEVFEKYGEVASFVRSLEGSTQGQKRRGAIDDFLREGVADPWLIARARAYGETIVTQEVPRPLKVGKVSLVDVCERFGVRHVEVVSFLREMKAVFALKR